MQVSLLVLVPLAAGAAAFAVRSDIARRLLVVATAVLHSGLTLSLWTGGKTIGERPGASDWLALDATGLLFLSIVSLLFLMTSYYTVGYLRREHEESHQDVEEGFYFRNAPEAVFTGCL